MAGLGFILERLGKEVTLFNASGLPEQYRWVSLPRPIVQSRVLPAVDVIIALDCGDVSRLGQERSFLSRAKEVVNIDHHQGNTAFGSLNWVEPGRSSVGEMIAQLAGAFGLELSGPLGEAIYLALITDTGSFTYSNTGPETLQLAAEIIRSGLDLDGFNARRQRQWSLNRVHLHGAAMQQARLHAQGRIGVIAVSKDMLSATGTSAEDCEALVNHVRTIRGVIIAVSLRQDAEQKVKFSLRSWGEVDVQAVAASLGGGGHRNAAGGVLEGRSLPEAEALIVAEASRHLGDCSVTDIAANSHS
jgi:phosphoesterase RecJ-like protein